MLCNNHAKPTVKRKCSLSVFVVLSNFSIFVSVMGNNRKDVNDMTFWEHLDAMRPGIFRTCIALVFVTIAAFLLKDYLMEIIMGPSSPAFPTNKLMSHLADVWQQDLLRINEAPLTLINTRIAGQFMMHFSLAFYVALVIAIPYALFELWLFVRPALTKNERRTTATFIIYAIICMLIGTAFGYFILSPISVDFLGTYVLSERITNYIDTASYISLVSTLTLVCAVMFELPIIVYFLVKAHILTAAFMRRYRRHALVILTISSALFTPPDVFSMVLVMIPLYVLYEAGIWVATFAERGMAVKKCKKIE